MRAPRQTTLAVEQPFGQRLDNFVAGPNQELVDGLKGLDAQPDFFGVWLCGAGGIGKSHLLRATCLAGQEQGRHASYVGCAAPNGRLAQSAQAQLNIASQFGQLVAVDDLALICGRGELEYLLMQTYQRLIDSGGTLIVSHAFAAGAVTFELADLNSRMRSLLHYHIQPLNDENKAELLRQRAEHKGYQLDDAVLGYWLARGPREISALLTDLNRLDRASLSRKRQVTIPLLKDELGY